MYLDTGCTLLNELAVLLGGLALVDEGAVAAAVHERRGARHAVVADLKVQLRDRYVLRGVRMGVWSV